MRRRSFMLVRMCVGVLLLCASACSRDPSAPADKNESRVAAADTTPAFRNLGKRDENQL